MLHQRALATFGLAVVAPIPTFHGPETLARGAGLLEEVASHAPIVFEGIVFDRVGAPAEGAVVVSSAGGRAVTDRRGRYRLEARAPVAAGSAWITAVAEGGKVASTLVDLSAAPGRAWIPPLEVASGSACQPSWLPTFGPEPGTNEHTSALAVFDDGSGPALYAGGAFTAAGGTMANHIAKWDGSSWSALGSGLDNSVFALFVFDDGSGPALYAGGTFTTAGGVAANRIAKWDGSSWSALDSGMNSRVSALTMFDDGSGPALYAGGNFTNAGGVAANRIAKWDGSSWEALSSGVNSGVEALTVFDDGSGPALYVGGSFTIVGGVFMHRIAKWDGSSWSPLDSGLDEPVSALTVFDDGNGPALYAGGDFWTAGGVSASGVASWNGSSWSALGSGTNGLGVRALTVFDDGNGPALYAGGRFVEAGGVAASNIARWDGSGWSALGSGITGLPTSSVPELTVFDDGRGPALFAGGFFALAGGAVSNNIARWRGSSWKALGDGLISSATALTVFDDGRGPALYAGGFRQAGRVTANQIARWDGSRWEPLGSGTSGASNLVWALTVFDDGGGPALYAGGEFTQAGGMPARLVAKWDGSSWSAPGSGLSGTAVRDLAVFDDGSGPVLYAGGSIQTNGGTNVAKWDGSSWEAVGGGIPPLLTLDDVRALEVFDDGNGPALYVGGRFMTAGAGVSAERIAKWDGSSWSALGSGITGGLGLVAALAVFDDGSGPALYAAGNFDTAGGVTANNIAKWDGSLWSAVGDGTDGEVGVLSVFDDGCGSELYAGGNFTIAGSLAAIDIARWDGTSWAPLGGGLGGQGSQQVLALTVFNDRTGPALHAGGTFQTSDGGDSYLAKWGTPDTTAPVISCPSAVVVDDRPGTDGETLTFLVTAEDEQDPTPALECHPPSGSHFPRGTTLVVCTATDAAGNQASCQFTVTVGAKLPEVLSSPPQAHR